jgi:hypothetical protein
VVTEVPVVQAGPEVVVLDIPHRAALLALQILAVVAEHILLAAPASSFFATQSLSRP